LLSPLWQNTPRRISAPGKGEGERERGSIRCLPVLRGLDCNGGSGRSDGSEEEGSGGGELHLGGDSRARRKGRRLMGWLLSGTTEGGGDHFRAKAKAVRKGDTGREGGGKVGHQNFSAFKCREERFKKRRGWDVARLSRDTKGSREYRRILRGRQRKRPGCIIITANVMTHGDATQTRDRLLEGSPIRRLSSCLVRSYVDLG
jgi:hypothetical protein